MTTVGVWLLFFVLPVLLLERYRERRHERAGRCPDCGYPLFHGWCGSCLNEEMKRTGARPSAAFAAHLRRMDEAVDAARARVGGAKEGLLQYESVDALLADCGIRGQIYPD